jgi:hypothetical protein
MSGRHRRTLGVTLAAAAVSVSLLAPTAASASTGDASDGGLWYYSATGMEQLHQRATGAGIRIAVIDGPVNPDAPDLAGTSFSVREPTYCVGADGNPGSATTDADYARHATHITSLLLGTGAGVNGEPGTKGLAPGAEVEVFALDAAGDLEPCTHVDTGRAFRDAITSGADIINVSGSYDLSSEDMILALREGTIVVGAAGNDGYLDGIPAMFNGAISVGTLAPDLQLAEGSPRDGVEVVAPGAEIRGIAGDWQRYGRATGSSDATAFTSAALALAWSLYPEATPNQMMQSLIRNAGGTEHEPAIVDDAWGYGAVNVRQMLDSDPTGYPDVNPFIEDTPTANPSASRIREALGMADPAASPTPTTEPERDVTDAADPPESESEDSSFPLPVVLGVVALLVVAGIVVAVVVTRRRSSTQNPTDPTSTSGGHHG